MVNQKSSLPTPPGPRFVLTGHTPEGKSTILRDGIPNPQALRPSSLVNVYTMYKCDELPAVIDAEVNGSVSTASLWAESYPNFCPEGGALMRAFDWPPGAESPMHRTDSLDFGVILKGSLEMHMEDGNFVILNCGDTFVQRGGQHMWKNTSEGWARILFIGFDAQPIILNGERQPDQMKAHLNLSLR